MSLICKILKSHTVLSPTAIAIVTDHESISYMRLCEQVDELSGWITSENCTTLAYQLDNGGFWAALDLAGMSTSVNLVPIPSFFSESQVLHTLEDAKVDLFITDSQFQPPAKTVGDTAWLSIAPPSGATPSSVTGQATQVAISCYKRNMGPAGDSDTKITYTSGSTGSPKGVVLRKETIETVSASIVAGMSSIDIRKHLCLLPLATLLENIAGLYAPLIKGVTVQLPSLANVGLSGASLDIERFAQTINETQADSIIVVPQLLTAVVTLSQFGIIDSSSLKMIAVGGGRVSEHLLKSAAELALPVYQGYGLSECCSVLTLNLPGANKQGSVGKPLPHAQIRISEEGEIEANGHIFSGYLGEEQEANDWYQTGDLGHIDADGFVYVTGRIKNVFITSFGRNVNPEWVESALTQQPEISQALVYGENQSHNLALVWLRFPEADTDMSSVLAKTNAELPDYARVHSYIIVSGTPSAELTTANGRLRRDSALLQYHKIIDDHFITDSSSTDASSTSASIMEQPIYTTRYH